MHDTPLVKTCHTIAHSAALEAKSDLRTPRHLVGYQQQPVGSTGARLRYRRDLALGDMAKFGIKVRAPVNNPDYFEARTDWRQALAPEGCQVIAKVQICASWHSHAVFSGCCPRRRTLSQERRRSRVEATALLSDDGVCPEQFVTIVVINLSLDIGAMDVARLNHCQLPV